MNLKEAMRELESAGTEQNRKLYKRHGVREPQFGVSISSLKALRKRIKTDHGLAMSLWKTRNADARLLATMVADPEQMGAKDLDRWVQDIGHYVLADVFVKEVVSRTQHARAKANVWSRDRNEWIGRAGWDLIGLLAMNDHELDDAYFVEQLRRIETTIGRAPNMTRHAMNNALIAIGLRNAKLEKLALASAERIGKVVVDHGATSCKTPDAAGYIARTKRYRAGKKAKAGTSKKASPSKASKKRTESKPAAKATRSKKASKAKSSKAKSPKAKSSKAKSSKAKSSKAKPSKARPTRNASTKAKSTRSPKKTPEGEKPSKTRATKASRSPSAKSKRTATSPARRKAAPKRSTKARKVAKPSKPKGSSRR